MKVRIVSVLFSLITGFVSLSIANNTLAQADISKVNTVPESCHEIEIFYSQTCPHCARALLFLAELKSRHPEISVLKHDIGEDKQALSRFFAINEQLQIERPGVPAFLICGQFITGFDNGDIIGRQIKQRLGLIQDEVKKTTRHEIHVPLIGKISLEQLGLPLFTIVIGLVDGFNPCAMWVLLFLLSLLVNLRDRTRILLIAGTFVFVSGAVYFAFMAAWLNLFLIIGFSRVLQVIIGTTALIIGAIHIKDFFAFKQGISLSIPDAAKPGLYTRMRQVIQAENLAAAMVSIFIIAILVNFLELLCTAGLPALYTQILTTKTLDYPSYYGYLLLYNLAYIFDDALMVSIVVYTLDRYKVQEQQGRLLKLLSGSVIFILGILLIVAPQILF